MSNGPDQASTEQSAVVGRITDLPGPNCALCAGSDVAGKWVRVRPSLIEWLAVFLEDLEPSYRNGEDLDDEMETAKSLLREFRLLQPAPPELDSAEDGG